MKTKKCFKCGRELPLSQFYRHSAMKDGHLNKCIECTRKDIQANYAEKSQDEVWMERERKRGREKYARLGYKEASRKMKIRVRRFLGNNLGNISKRLRTRGYDTKGKEAHHWNYNYPLSVFLISRRAHHRIHQHLTVNYNDKCCYTDEGAKLECELDAIVYFQRILANYDIHEELLLAHI